MFSKTTFVLCLGSIFLTLIMYERFHDNTLFKYLTKRRSIYKERQDRKTLFHNYLQRFNKSYGKKEFKERFLHFKKSLKQIRKMNYGSHATFGLTKFSDWSKQELQRKLFTNNVGACDSRLTHNCGDGLFPNFRKIWKIRRMPRVDWRETGAVGAILDQKVCRACWAFSIVGVMESMTFIRYKQFTRLSIQQLMDCSYDTKAEKTGCTKGRPLVDVLRFLCETQISLTTEKLYPLTLADNPFDQCPRIPRGVQRIKSFENHCDMYKNETKLLEALNVGPVTALVNADFIYNYLHGIININCKTKENELNHAVQIVGYDVTDGILHYIVRNSWGNDWGEKGYVRLAVGGNQCGIAYSIGILDVY